MGNASSSITTPFSHCPIEQRVQSSWWPGTRSWRDSTDQNNNIRARVLRRPEDFQLIIQESSIVFGFGKIYRLVMAPLQDNGKVIVIAPHLIEFQEAVSMMMTIYLRRFRVSSQFRCFVDGRETVGEHGTISPEDPWPPAQDRISLGAQFDGSENESGVVRLLSCESEADIEADIVLWHGLGGDPETSWTSDQDPSAWPIWRLLDPGNVQDNLYAAEGHRLPPNSLPRQHQIRALSVCHKLSVTGSGDSLMDEDPRTTVNTIWESFARAQIGLRPSVWLCHSLGSLLAKEVLMLDESEGPNGLRLRDNLRGVLFYGAPHNGSQWAGALSSTRLSVSLYPLDFQLHIARRALEYLARNNAHHLEELNHFFFGKSNIPFMNFQETRAVEITRHASIAQIVHLEESNIAKYMPPDRPLITERILPLDFLAQPERLCVQAEVNFNHLDICKPQWPNGRPQRIYTWSREAIAVWLRWVPQGDSLPQTTAGAWSAQLASEVAAMQAAMTVALASETRTVILPDEVPEAIYYNCAWSNDGVFRGDHIRHRSDLSRDESTLLRGGARNAAGITGLARSYEIANPGSINPLLVLQAAAVILGTGAVIATTSTVLTGAELAPLAAAILVLGLAMSGQAREAVNNAYQTLSLDTLRLAHARPDVIFLSGVLEKHLSDTFDRIDRYRYISPSNKNSLKHHWLRRYRDILCTQLLLPTPRGTLDAGDIDLLADARSKLENVTEHRNIPAILRRLLSIRAEYREARQADEHR